MRLSLPFDKARPLADRLFAAGVEFPCGGESACGGCRVRLLSGDVPVTEKMREALSEAELAAGWRLACDAAASGDVVVEAGEWQPRILTDESRVELEPRPGIGAVVDLGTTTLVAQTVDRRTGEVLGVEAALNPQARHGADLMSRIQFEMREPGVLGALVRDALGAMLRRLAGEERLEEILLCGNTAMHHLFCGFDVEPLSRVPFESPTLGARRFSSAELGWPGPAEFLPCLGGFVGSDLLAGVVAVSLDRSPERRALFDIGTNGEIVAGDGNELLCASTAAGPAFEGGRISIGMRAGDGAIDGVHGAMECHVLGGGTARGICGSGLVDAVACARSTDLLAMNGRIRAASRTLPLRDGLSLSQADVRELQLAKGAMAAGLKMLGGGLRRLHLAGAFGNYIRLSSARAIGLLPEGVEVEPVGNAALRGTRQLLLGPSWRQARIDRILAISRHVELAAGAGFASLYAESMALEPFRPR